MPSKELNMSVASEVIQRIFGDKGMTLEDAIEVLESIQEECEDYLNALKEDLNAS